MTQPTVQPASAGLPAGLLGPAFTPGIATRYDYPEAVSTAFSECGFSPMALAKALVGEGR